MRDPKSRLKHTSSLFATPRERHRYDAAEGATDPETLRHPDRTVVKGIWKAAKRSPKE